jgi:hypothetical protein
MLRSGTKRWAGPAVAAVVLGLLLTIAPSAFAQGCAMCYANASQQNDKAARALNLGILALLTPTLVLFGGVFFLARRSRNRHDAPDTTL